ncbi:MAG TPA: HAD-IA family hydrolase [Kineosporiaceae bacterium]|nr:HAD-IA family hydrolase [Kineosporiaceae bacterium]
MDLSDVRAVLLDMDGTLVDSDAAVERAWRAWSGEYGVPSDTTLTLAHGNPSERTARILLPGLDDDALLAAAQRQLDLQYDDLSDVRALPGAQEVVDVLHRWRLPWAVVTSADQRLARARLDVARIVPPVLVTVEDVARGKPDPEGYLLAARLLGVEPPRCLVVEDSEPGIAAGRSAGMRVASLRGLPGDLVLRDLRDLARLLAASGPT